MPWVMQAFGQIVDKSLTYDALKDLGAKLKPPAGLGGFNEECRARDVAQRPQNNREKNHRGNAGVMPEAKGVRDLQQPA